MLNYNIIFILLIIGLCSVIFCVNNNISTEKFSDCVDSHPQLCSAFRTRPMWTEPLQWQASPECNHLHEGNIAEKCMNTCGLCPVFNKYIG